MLSAGTTLVGEEKWIFGLANLMSKCFIDQALVVSELQITDFPRLPRGLYPYLQRLPSSNPNIEALARSAHIAILVPIHVFSDLIMDVKLPICVHERLCETQHH